jgi:hypothetical protein
MDLQNGSFPNLRKVGLYFLRAGGGDETSKFMTNQVTRRSGRIFDQMPHLADELENAGCDNQGILGHSRGPGAHVRGCWVVDIVLGKG